MITVPIKSSKVAGSEINLRPPGSAVVRRIRSELDSDGQLPLSAIPRLAARLPGRSESSISKLSEDDLNSLHQTILTLFRKEERRLRARKAQDKTRAEMAE